MLVPTFLRWSLVATVVSHKQQKRPTPFPRRIFERVTTSIERSVLSQAVVCVRVWRVHVVLLGEGSQQIPKCSVVLRSALRECFSVNTQLG